MHKPYLSARLFSGQLHLHNLLLIDNITTIFIWLNFLVHLTLGICVGYWINETYDFFAGQTQFADLIEIKKLQQTHQHHLPARWQQLDELGLGLLPHRAHIQCCFGFVIPLYLPLVLVVQLPGRLDLVRESLADERQGTALVCAETFH